MATKTVEQQAITQIIANVDPVAEQRQAAEQAEEHLAALQEEQRTIVQRRMAAANAADSKTYFELGRRKEEVESEIRFASATIKRMQITMCDAYAAYAATALPTLDGGIADLNKQMEPLRAQTAVLGNKADKIREHAKYYRSLKAAVEISLENELIAQQREEMAAAAPVMRNMIGLYG